MKQVPIIIPSYEPDERLIILCRELYEANLKDVIIVNDGSNKKYDYIFEKIEKDYHFIILKHPVNYGKGRGLKTAFNYLLSNRNDISGCITADSDGQHSVKDIKRCIIEFNKHPNSLILGCRDFSSDNVPKKSRLGNNITKMVFKWFCGIKVSDTQTGLRVIPKDFMIKLLSVKGDRFEYETNMLLENTYPIIEVSIETIYDSKENHSTHFNPIVDSFKIYKSIFKVFFKYIISSFSSFIVDILLFMLFVSLFKKTFTSEYIIISTVLARVISSIYNYLLNHKFVFTSNKEKRETMYKYFILVIVLMLLSSLLVNFIVKKTLFNETIVKLCVDIVLFFISFFVQKKIIFKDN